MKKVIIKVGGYGYRPDKDSAVQLITEKNGPISVSDAEAKRLVDLKVAVYVGEESTSNSELKTGHLDAGQFADYSYKELQKLAKDMGLSATGSKDELIERITTAEVQYEADAEAEEVEADAEAEETEPAEDAESDTEEPPVLEAVDPE